MSATAEMTLALTSEKWVNVVWQNHKSKLCDADYLEAARDAKGNVTFVADVVYWEVTMLETGHYTFAEDEPVGLKRKRDNVPPRPMPAPPATAMPPIQPIKKSDILQGIEDKCGVRKHTLHLDFGPCDPVSGKRKIHVQADKEHFFAGQIFRNEPLFTHLAPFLEESVYLAFGTVWHGLKSCNPTVPKIVETLNNIGLPYADMRLPSPDGIMSYFDDALLQAVVHIKAQGRIYKTAGAREAHQMTYLGLLGSLVKKFYKRTLRELTNLEEHIRSSVRYTCTVVDTSDLDEYIAILRWYVRNVKVMIIPAKNLIREVVIKRTVNAAVMVQYHLDFTYAMKTIAASERKRMTFVARAWSAWGGSA